MTAIELSTDRLPRPRRALSALDRLRARLRRVLLVDGFVALGWALCAMVAATFLLDRSLQLPRPVRLVMLLAVLGYLLSVVLRRLVKPRRSSPSEEELAVIVEGQNPQLRQSLITAVQLTRESHRAAPFLSGALIREVVSEVESGLARVSFDRVLRRDRLLRSGLGLTAAAAALILLAASHAELSTVWFQRVVLLGSSRWPKNVRLELIRPHEPVTVALGEDLPVEVKVVRGEPRQVEADTWTTGGTRRTVPMRAMPERIFRSVFDSVNEPFTFQVRGGDDVLNPVRVEVELRPRVSRLGLWCEYPAYTAREPTPPGSPILNGHVRVPEGTRVRYRAISDVEVAEARFIFSPTGSALTAEGADADDGRETRQLEVLSLEGRPEFAAAIAPDAAPPVSGSGFEGSFTVEKSGTYSFLLTGVNGLLNRNPVRYRIRVIEDRPPSVRIEEPARINEEVSPEAKVPVVIRVRDDYGIREGALEGVITPSDRPVHRELEELAAADSKSAVDDRTVKLELDVQALGAQPGQRIQFLAQAKDFGDNLGESDHYVLHVVTAEELMGRIYDQLTVIKGQIQTTQRQQESAAKDTDTLLRETSLDGKVDAEDAAKLTRGRQEQQRVTSSLGRSVGDLERLLKRMDFNQVGAEKERSWVRGIRESLQKLADEDSRGVEKKITALRDAAKQASRETRELDAILSDQRRIGRELNSLALRLTEFGDLNAVIQQWRDMLRREKDIRDGIRSQIRGEGGTR